MPSSLSVISPAAKFKSMDALRTMVRDAMVSTHSKRAYLKAVDDFFALIESAGRPISRALLMQYRAAMIEAGLSASTINLRLSAIRKLVREARDNSLIDPIEAERISGVAGVAEHGVRLGQWLTPKQTRELLAVPDRTRLKGKRDHAILSVLANCALRRSELSQLKVEKIQQREGRWVIADLFGKGGRVRTVPLPRRAKLAIDQWTKAAGITSGFLLRRVSKTGRALSGALSDWTVWKVVVTSGEAIGIKHLGAHDLRRSCAKMCRKKGGELEQIQFLLGHVSIVTTQVYLGSTQEIAKAVNDGLGI